MKNPIEFKEPHFKMVVLYHLMKLGHHVNELDAIVEQHKQDEDAKLKTMAGITEYCKNVQFTAAELAEVKTLKLTGSNPLFDELISNWTWDHSWFPTYSIEDLRHLPNIEIFKGGGLTPAVDFSPLLKLEHLKGVTFASCSNEFIRQLALRGVWFGDAPSSDEQFELTESDERKVERLSTLMKSARVKLEQVTTFDAFHEFCIDFYATSELCYPIQLSFEETETDALRKLEQLGYPQEFMDWHSKFGGGTLRLESIELLASDSLLVQEVEYYSAVLTKNNYLVIAKDWKGNAFVYDKNCDSPTTIKQIDASVLQKITISLINFYEMEHGLLIDDDGTIVNPNHLDITKVLDKDGKHLPDSPYVSSHLAENVKPTAFTGKTSLLDFLLKQTSNGFDITLLEIEKGQRYPLHLRLNPMVEDMHNKAIDFERGGYYEHALTNYTRAIALNTEFLPTLNNRAFVYYKLKRYQEALTDIDKAISLDSKDGMAHATRAEILFGMNDEEGMFKSLQNSANLGFDLDMVDEAINDKYGNDSRYIAIVSGM